MRIWNRSYKLFLDQNNAVMCSFLVTNNLAENINGFITDSLELIAISKFDIFELCSWKQTAKNYIHTYAESF